MVKCESLRINMFRITHTGKISKFFRNKMLGTSYVTDLPEILKKKSFSLLPKTFNLPTVDTTFMEVNFSNVLLVLHVSPFT